MASICGAAVTPPWTAFGSRETYFALPLQGRVSALQGRVRARLLIQKALESPRQHFAHHAEIIARCDVHRFDVELAVLLLAQALRPRDDHCADGIRALDMTIVVDLNAARRPCQGEGAFDRGEEPLLVCRLVNLT